MSRYFKVDITGAGGEFVMGKVAREFAEYWDEVGDSDSLVTHLQELEWEGDAIDPESPDMTEEGNTPWFEIDDYEHLTGGYSDCSASYVECNEEGEELDDADWNEIALDEYMGCGREMYSSGDNGDVPVLMYHQSEKGSFGQVVIKTDGDFDPDLLRTVVVETDLGEFIERVFYAGVEFDIDFDYSDTRGNFSEARVGFVNEEWIEKDIDDEVLKESLELEFE